MSTTAEGPPLPFTIRGLLRMSAGRRFVPVLLPASMAGELDCRENPFALGTMRFAAAALGWKLRLLDHVGAAAASQLLGLDREADYAGAEREHPELVALVVREKWASDRGLCLCKELVTQVATSRWYGTANVRSPEHGVDWPVIDQVAAATTNPRVAADEEFSRFPSEEELFGAPVRSGAFTAEKGILRSEEHTSE